LIKPAEERVHEAGDLRVALRSRLPSVDRHDIAHRNGRHRRTVWNQCRVRVVLELVGQIGLRQCLRERHTQKMQAAGRLYVREQRYWCATDMKDRGDIAVLELGQPVNLLVVGDRRLDAKRLENDFGRHGRTAALYVDIDGLTVEVFQLGNVAPRQEVDLLIIELGDVANALHQAGEHVVLLRVGQSVRLHKADIDASEVEDIGEILQRSLAVDRQYPERAVVKDGQVGGGPRIGSAFHPGNDADGALIGMRDSLSGLLLGHARNRDERAKQRGHDLLHSALPTSVPFPEYLVL